MKKLINDPRAVTTEYLEGLAAAHPALLRISTHPAFVVRADAPVPGKVAILSGGGSGHEPLHAGFVGAGMLDAAVPGPVFTSPTPDPIVAATKAVDGGAGVLYVVKNYTGDVLNFETAAELASLDGVEVRTVVVNDDVAVRDSLYTAGRRGVAGALVVEKIAGAAAERGDDLDAIVHLCRRVIGLARSMGVAITPPTVPHSGEPSFVLADDEVEFGIGIHGEPGRARTAFAPVDRLVDELLEAILEDRPIAAGSRVLVVLNGMGSTPSSELYIAFRRVAQVLASAGIEIERSLVGSLVTSLDMQGFSITVVPLDDELVRLWDAPVHTAALRWGR
ncbi:MAG TPA: dihydroxyacetone kinase subunit DhaK [Humibacter sp.]|nr:dihydroxyacetone kinase subunit DhaK [Humibacter sp.]